MIEVLLIFLCFFLYFGAREIVKLIEQNKYEKRRFYLMVAEELDRLDKATKEAKQVEIKSRNPSIWEMRN